MTGSSFARLELQPTKDQCIDLTFCSHHPSPPHPSWVAYSMDPTKCYYYIMVITGTGLSSISCLYHIEVLLQTGSMQSWSKVRYYKFKGSRKLLSPPEFGGDLQFTFGEPESVSRILEVLSLSLVLDYIRCLSFSFFHFHPSSRKVLSFKVNIFLLFVEFITNQSFKRGDFGYLQLQPSTY